MRSGEQANLAAPSAQSSELTAFKNKIIKSNFPLSKFHYLNLNIEYHQASVNSRHFWGERGYLPSKKTYNPPTAAKLCAIVKYDTIRDAILTCARKPTYGKSA